MKKLMKNISLLVLAVAVCVGLNAVSVEAASSAKVKSVSMKTTTGGDFVKGVSKAEVKFKISGKKSDVTVKILDDSGKTVYKKSFKGCKVDKEYSFKWDGKKSSGSWAKDDYYCAKVEAGKSSKKSSALHFVVKTGFAGGDGSKANPYKVSSAAEFKNVAKHNGRRFVQTKSIDFKGGACTPLFTPDAPFSGVYDGKGYTISNITYNSQVTGIGLFRGNKGTIKNLKLKNCVYSGNDRVGAIVGYNEGTVIGCSVSDCTVNGQTDNGAVVGFNMKGTIESCKTSGNTVVSSRNSASAITGYNNGTVKKCSSKGDMISASGDHAGAMVGYNEGTVMACTVTESYIQAGWYAGGVAGTNRNIIKDCTVYDEKGQIKANYHCGGIAGQSVSGGILAGNTYVGLLNETGN